MPTKRNCKSGWVNKLWYAVEHNAVHTVQHLIQQGADINHPFPQVRTEQGHKRKKQTAIFIAVRKRYKTMIQLLLDSKCNLNISDDRNETALFAAVASKKLTIIKMLVEAGCNINHRNSKGENVHFIATKLALPEVLTYLLSKGCDPDVKSDSGFNPLGQVLCNHFGTYCPGDRETRTTSTGKYLNMFEILVKSTRDISASLGEDCNSMLSFILDLQDHQLALYMAVMILREGIDPNQMESSMISPVFRLQCMTDRTNCGVKIHDILHVYHMMYAAGLDIYNQKNQLLEHDILLSGAELEGIDADRYRKSHSWEHTPRSLKDLARLTIRRSVRSRLSLQIPKLYIPKVLHEYLLLTEFGKFSFSKKFEHRFVGH